MAQGRIGWESLVRIEIYVEGGGQGKHLKAKCREGFGEFFKKAGLANHMPRIKACGSRTNALEDFREAVRRAKDDRIPILLVDSEGTVQRNNRPWQHLRSRDGWERPAGVSESQAQLMVQNMESWFLADVSALESFFGTGFRSAAIPQRNDIERIPKDDVEEQLESASRGSNKRAYNKGRHSFDILARIDPEKVIRRSRFAKRLIDTLKRHLIPA